jgi:hypothetical protein
MTPADEPAEQVAEEDRLLAEHAFPAEEGRWHFGIPSYTHGRASSLALIRACLALGVTVTDTATAEAWWRLVSRVLDVERRLAALERREAS